MPEYADLLQTLSGKKNCSSRLRMVAKPYAIKILTVAFPSCKNTLIQLKSHPTGGHSLSFAAPNDRNANIICE